MKRRILCLFHSFGSLVLSGLFCLLLGVITSYAIKNCDTAIFAIVSITAAISISILIGLYYHYEYNRIGVEKKKASSYLKYIYWGVSGVCFGIYMICVYPSYLDTYKQNIFGLDQRQYIILLNFILFLILDLIIYQLVTMKYSIKNIGPEGIELEHIIEDNSIEAMQISSELTGDIYKELVDLDKVVDYLYSTETLYKDISEAEYLNIFDKLCTSLVEGKDGVNIKVFSSDKYSIYLKKQLGLKNDEIERLYYSYEEYGIIKVENGIHIKYDFASFHSFQAENCYIVMEFNQIYDIQIGKLIYAYLSLFEALYSKYILIEE